MSRILAMYTLLIVVSSVPIGLAQTTQNGSFESMDMFGKQDDDKQNDDERNTDKKQWDIEDWLPAVIVGIISLITLGYRIISDYMKLNTRITVLETRLNERDKYESQGGS